MLIIVLEDGETYSPLDECMIIEIEDEILDDPGIEGMLRDLQDGPAQMKEGGPVRLFTFLESQGFELRDSKTHAFLSVPPK